MIFIKRGALPVLDVMALDQGSELSWNYRASGILKSRGINGKAIRWAN